jgi:hypothetical protein
MVGAKPKTQMSVVISSSYSRGWTGSELAQSGETSFISRSYDSKTNLKFHIDSLPRISHPEKPLSRLRMRVTDGISLRVNTWWTLEEAYQWHDGSSADEQRTQAEIK